MRSALVVSGVLALSAIFTPGCTVKTAVVEPTIPSIVDDGLETMTTAENQQRIKALLELSDVETTSHSLARALVSGALQELTAPERQAELDRLTSEFVLSVSEALSQGTDEHLGPAIARQTSKALSANLEVLFADGVRRDSAEYVAAITQAFSATLNRSLSEGIQNHTAPAIARAWEKDLAPGVARGVDEDLRPALGRVSREMAREAGLGLGDALKGGLGDAIDSRLLGRVEGWFAEGQTFAELALTQLRVAIGALVVLLAMLGGVLFWLYRAFHKRTAALELVTHAVKEFTGKAGDRSIVELVELRGQQGPGRAALKEFLQTRPQLKA